MPAGILRDKTIDAKFMYITSFYNYNYSLCKIILEEVRTIEVYTKQLSFNKSTQSTIYKTLGTQSVIS